MSRIETQRLVLKPFSEGDEARLAMFFTNEEIKKTYMLPDFQSEEQCRKLAVRFRELSRDDSRFVAGIYLNGLLIGFLNDVEIDGDCIELGYVIEPEHWGHGYATEALMGAMNHLLEKGFREVVAGAFADNPASIRVMQKAGMKRIEKEEQIRYRGVMHLCVYYVMTGNQT